MQVTYTSRDYDPSHTYRRYVRKDWNGEYRWCETDDRGYDARQGIVTGGELPGSVRAAADRMLGQAFGYVEWPL